MEIPFGSQVCIRHIQYKTDFMDGSLTYLFYLFISYQALYTMNNHLTYLCRFRKPHGAVNYQFPLPYFPFIYFFKVFTDLVSKFCFCVSPWPATSHCRLVPDTFLLTRSSSTVSLVVSSAAWLLPTRVRTHSAYSPTRICLSPSFADLDGRPLSAPWGGAARPLPNLDPSSFTSTSHLRARIMFTQRTFVGSRSSRCCSPKYTLGATSSSVSKYILDNPESLHVSGGILLPPLSKPRERSSDLALLRGPDRPDIRPCSTGRAVSKFILDTSRSPSSKPRKRCSVWTLFRRAGHLDIRPCLSEGTTPKCILGVFFKFTLGFLFNFVAQLQVRLALRPLIAPAVVFRPRE